MLGHHFVPLGARFSQRVLLLLLLPTLTSGWSTSLLKSSGVWTASNQHPLTTSTPGKEYLNRNVSGYAMITTVFLYNHRNTSKRLQVGNRMDVIFVWNSSGLFCSKHAYVYALILPGASEQILAASKSRK
ncbi:hypothetical protein SCHPADRAFT_316432 [Schizopora paradoxa]|uniref:Uncharacterized protein n=1 Tax=Schizopora paradoxa TaxID=27342 RepID=A0A0H2RS63_9AGAM|nr:hypothetical protein SCHPADRAFT_316432 [Schizopora paradoxa]